MIKKPFFYEGLFNLRIFYMNNHLILLGGFKSSNQSSLIYIHLINFSPKFATRSTLHYD